LNNLEKKNLRGKESGNSKEFNSLMRAYDDIREKFGNSKLTTEQRLEEIAKFKEAAMEYIGAKREQKGYEKIGVPDSEIDDKMLGKTKGASIFTSRGKDRYEFALNALRGAITLEQKVVETEKPRPKMVFSENYQTSFDDNEWYNQPSDKQEQKEQTTKTEDDFQM
jgi:hypothetical protein